MDQLWSASTTMRNPERTQFFLQVAAELEGEVWTHETQRRLQALLIQRRFYGRRSDPGAARAPGGLLPPDDLRRGQGYL